MFKRSQIINKLSKYRTLCACAQCSTEYECNIYDAARSNVGHLCTTCKTQISSLSMFTQQDLLRVFRYNEVTGELTYANDSLSGQANQPAGYPHVEGYLSVAIGRKEYLVHRVIWFMRTGVWPDQIDHQDHDRRNNSWRNLRAIGSRENQLNLGQRKNVSSCGVGVRKLSGGKFWAYIMVHRKQISLGSFTTQLEATEARKSAEVLYGFHVNHGS